MSNPSNRRNPLLIPLLLALALAAAGIALFVMRNGDYQRQQTTLTTLTQQKADAEIKSAVLSEQVSSLTTALDTAKADNTALTQQKATLETTVADLTTALDAAKAENTALTQQKAALETTVADLTTALDAAKAENAARAEAENPVGSYQMTKYVYDGEEWPLDGFSCYLEINEDGTALLYKWNGNGMNTAGIPFLWAMDGDELMLTMATDELDGEVVVRRVQGFTRFRLEDSEDTGFYMMFERIQPENPVGSYQMTKYVFNGKEQSLSATLTLREDGTGTLAVREGEEEWENSLTWRVCGRLLILEGESIDTIAGQIEPGCTQIYLSRERESIVFEPIQ